MEFSRELRPAVLSGDISVSIRLWQRSKVKTGARYRVGDGEIEIDAVEQIPFAYVDEADVRRSGETDRESLRRRAAHAGPIHNDTLVYRIEFHVVDVGQDVEPSLSTEIERVRHDSEFKSRLEEIVMRDKEIQDRLAR